MAAFPEVLRLHRARLTAHDVETIDGVRVTTPLRTLVDVIVDGDLGPSSKPKPSLKPWAVALSGLDRSSTPR
jgi:hypothetical protein